MPQHRRDSFCGPAGNGLISQALSRGITWALFRLGVNLEEACRSHDVDWNDGPNTVDDIRFALKVYESVKDQKGPLLAGVMSAVGFLLVRITAIVYKLMHNEV